MSDLDFVLEVMGSIHVDYDYIEPLLSTEGSEDTTYKVGKSRATKLAQDADGTVVFCQSESSDMPWNVLATTEIYQGDSRKYPQKCYLGAPDQCWFDVLICLPDLYEHLHNYKAEPPFKSHPPLQLRVAEDTNQDAQSIGRAIVGTPLNLRPMNDGTWWEKHSDHLSKMLPSLLSADRLSIINVKTVNDQVKIIAGIASLLPERCRPLLTFASANATLPKEIDEYPRITFARSQDKERPVFNWAKCDFDQNWQPEVSLPLPPSYQDGLNRKSQGLDELRRRLSEDSVASLEPIGRSTLYLAFIRSYPDQSLTSIAEGLAGSGHKAERLRKIDLFLNAVMGAFEAFPPEERQVLARLNWEAILSTNDDSLGTRVSKYPNLLSLWATVCAKDGKILETVFETKPEDSAISLLISLGKDFWGITNVAPQLTRALVQKRKSPSALLQVLWQNHLITPDATSDAMDRWLQASPSKETALDVLDFWLSIGGPDNKELELRDPKLKSWLPETSKMLYALAGNGTGTRLEAVAAELENGKLAEILEEYAVKRKLFDLIRFKALCNLLTRNDRADQALAVNEIYRRAKDLSIAEVLDSYALLKKKNQDETRDARSELAKRLVYEASESRNWNLLSELHRSDFKDWSSELERNVRKILDTQNRHGKTLTDYYLQGARELQPISIDQRWSASAALLTCVCTWHDASSLIPRDQKRLTRTPTDSDFERGIDLLQKWIDEPTQKNIQQNLLTSGEADTEWKNCLNRFTKVFLSESCLVGQRAIDAVVTLAQLYDEIGIEQQLRELVKNTQPKNSTTANCTSSDTKELCKQLRKRGYRQLAKAFEKMETQQETKVEGNKVISRLGRLAVGGLMAFLGIVAVAYAAYLFIELTDLRAEQEQLVKRVDVLMADLESSNTGFESRFQAIEETLTAIKVASISPATPLEVEQSEGASNQSNETTTLPASDSAPQEMAGAQNTDGSDVAPDAGPGEGSESQANAGSSAPIVLAQITVTPTPGQAAANDGIVVPPIPTVVGPQETPTGVPGETTDTAPVPTSDYRQFPILSKVYFVADNPFLLTEPTIDSNQTPIERSAECTVTQAPNEANDWVKLVCPPGIQGWVKLEELRR